MFVCFHDLVMSLKLMVVKTENSWNLLITRRWTGPSGIFSGLTSVLWRKPMPIAIISLLKMAFCLRFPP